MKALRAGGLLLATVIGLTWASVAVAQEATTESTTTDETTTTTTTNESGESAPGPWAETPRTRYLERRALWFKLVARRLSHLTEHERPRVDRTRTDFASLLRYRLWLRDAWHTRADRARYRAHHPPHQSEWRCIHRFEAPWTDPDSPYYGGLQMDLGFQRAYGPELLRRKGTANHWAPYEQMWVAERALRAGRGFYPWPMTARQCGLI